MAKDIDLDEMKKSCCRCDWQGLTNRTYCEVCLNESEFVRLQEIICQWCLKEVCICDKAHEGRFD